MNTLVLDQQALVEIIITDWKAGCPTWRETTQDVYYAAIDMFEMIPPAFLHGDNFAAGTPCEFTADEQPIWQIFAKVGDRCFTILGTRRHYTKKLLRELPS